jgi:hypothetical protein
VLLAGDAMRVLLASAPAGKSFAAGDALAVLGAAFVLIALGWIASRRGAAQGALAFAIGAATGFLFLYVVGAEWKARFLQSATAARSEELDGYDACIIEASKPPGA